MNHPVVSRENKIIRTGYGRAGLEAVVVPDNIKVIQPGAAGRSGPSPAIQPVSERFPALEESEIMLTFFDPEAAAVSVVGNFNGWRPEATPLENLGDGKWVVRLLLRSGQYEYRFVVDGRWSEDPEAVQRLAGPQGDFNSVFMVPLAVKTSIL